MKKRYYIFIFFFTISINCQEVSSFFNDKTFELNHFIKNGEVEELDLKNPNDPSGNTSRGVPLIEFDFNSEENQLEASISGYCNGTEVKYKIFENCLEILLRGGTTLADCGGDESIDYFFPLKGIIDYNTTTDKVFFKFTEDKKGLWLWIDENHKLYFTKQVLSIEENQLEKAISIYPNPTNNYINIDVKQANIKLSQVSIIDFQGKEIIKKSSNFESIDISKLAKGIYFLKIRNDANLLIIKKFIKT